MKTALLHFTPHEARLCRTPAADFGVRRQSAAALSHAAGARFPRRSAPSQSGVALRLPPHSIILPLTLALFTATSAIPAQSAQGSPPDYDRDAAIAPVAALATAAGTSQVPLTGIGPACPTNAIHPGDSVTALVNLLEKDGHNIQWLLHVQAVTPTRSEASTARPPPLVMYSDLGTTQTFESLTASATLRTLGPFSDSGPKNVTSKSHGAPVPVTLNAGWLGIGLDRAAAAVLRIMRTKQHGSFGFQGEPYSEAQIKRNLQGTNALRFTPDEQRALAGTYPAMTSYFSIVQNSKDLEPILFKLAERPSLWSFVVHGLVVDFTIDPAGLGPADPVKWGLATNAPAYYLPLVLYLNRRRAVNLVFVVTAPRPPLLLCGGIVGMIAERPGDKSTRLTLRVLSAHCAGAAP